MIDLVLMGCRDTVVGGLSYIGGRLTAPVSGDEGKDKEVADKAKANVNRGADKLSNANQETRDTVWRSDLQYTVLSPYCSMGAVRSI